jgi:hypothetical protein
MSEVIAETLETMEQSQELKDLTDQELADRLMQDVWADIDITTEESWIVMEAICRLRGERE